MNLPDSLFIDGKFRAGSAGKRTRLINPATEETLGEVAAAEVNDLNAAIESAHRAWEGGWRDLAPGKRAEILFNVARVLRENLEELAQLEALNIGKPISDARDEIGLGARVFEYYAGAVGKFFGQTIPVARGGIDFTLRQPMGVVSCIVPWNFPFPIASWKAAPALAAGNCVVVKPSEVTPLSTVELGTLVAEAGFPPGVVNIVNGPGDPVGMALVRDPRVAKISFTGGTVTGKKIFREAASTVKRLTLELGGKSASLVFADADLGKAVGVAYNDMVRNSGQVCGACTRLLLHESIADAFIEALAAKLRPLRIGLPDDPATEMGPLVSPVQLARVTGYLEIGRNEGAHIESYSDPRSRPELASGCYIAPTLIQGATNAMRVAREEIFGPVLTVIRFGSEEEAVRVANDSSYGLAACVFTSDASRAMRLTRSLSAGTVCVNTGVRSSVDAPFGGFRESGLGKERGKEALLDDTQIKNVRYGLA